MSKTIICNEEKLNKKLQFQNLDCSCTESTNWVCNNSAPLWCTIWTPINDNGANSCWTIRTWNCAWIDGWITSPQCSIANPICQL